MEIRFGSQSYQHRSLPLSAQRMVNCYLEAAPPAAKSQVAVVPNYGIVERGTVGNGPIRGGKVINGQLFVVSGTRLFAVREDGSSTDLGYVGGFGPVQIEGDGITLMILAGTAGYLYDGETVALVPDSDFPPAAWLTYLDGYYIVGQFGTGKVYVNETPYVPAVWNPLDFATAERVPDDTTAGIADHGEVFVFGRESTQVWRNTGNADFPLEDVSSGAIEVGCRAPRSPAKADNSVLFLGHDGIVYRMEGYTPVRVSTHAVEQAIEGYADKDGIGMVFQEGGHKFYALSFAEGTWVYDLATTLWHERQSRGHARWRPAFALTAHDAVWVGDYASNKLGTLSADVFTEWGEVLRSSCASPAIESENKRCFHSSVELVFEQGVGLTVGQGSEPKVMIDWSNDGGRTWSAEKWRSLGRIGEYRRRARVARAGSARDRVYRFSVSDPVRRTLIKSSAEVEVGTS